MAKKSTKKKKCNCWSCQLSPKIRGFEKSLNSEQKAVFDEIFGEVWDHMEAAEMELDVLNAKFDGSWPDPDPMMGGYHHRVGDNLYWFRAVLLENE